MQQQPISILPIFSGLVTSDASNSIPVDPSQIQPFLVCTFLCTNLNKDMENGSLHSFCGKYFKANFVWKFINHKVPNILPSSRTYLSGSLNLIAKRECILHVKKQVKYSNLITNIYPLSSSFSLPYTLPK